MSRLVRQPVLFLIFGLAILGLGHQLLNNPVGLLLSLAIGAAIAVGLYFLFTRVIMKRFSGHYGGGGMSAQSKGAPSSSPKSQQVFKKSMQQQQPAARQSQPQKRKAQRSAARRKEDPNLRVIEGKKNKKKNRALF
ncbi:hypothetical protein [Salsuginibacillus kocurii]|uniref:hypothetical protein n=1 Tax=Salsuginibacillus kocurii TaxID=427078 RepID=UPI00036791EB|nr:hypothetical protein [Salsuginibacillus kocurii]